MGNILSKNRHAVTKIAHPWWGGGNTPSPHVQVHSHLPKDITNLGHT